MGRAYRVNGRGGGRLLGYPVGHGKNVVREEDIGGRDGGSICHKVSDRRGKEREIDVASR